MRITIVTGFFLPVPAVSGGATERSWYGLARIFAASGHAVTFVSRSWRGPEPAEDVPGLRHLRLSGFDHTRHLVINLMLDFMWGVRVSLALPPGDVVICNTIFMPVWLRAMKASAGRVAVMFGRSPKGQERFYGGVARFYAPSSFIAQKLASTSAAARTKVIGNPIDWPLLARSSSQLGKPITIGYAGRLNPEKGIALLVRAACILSLRKELPEWRLRIVGPAGINEGGGGDAWVGALRKEAADALGDRVEWMGPEFNVERLARLYGSMDVFCYPSLAEKGETFGVGVAEAMAARCAVVVSALGCFSDLVTHGETGLVFDHASPDADRLLAESLGLLLADAPRRNAMALRGQQKARQFDYPEVSRNILEDLVFLTGAGAKIGQQSDHA